MKKSRIRTSERVAEIEISAIKEMAILSARTEGSVSLAWGVPSFRTPRHIRRAVAAQLEADPDIGMYSLPDGLPELREAAAREHLASTGVEVDPERNVMISAGNMEGLKILFQTILDPGDEVVVTDPGFASHFVQIRLCGGEPVYWKLDESRGWCLDVDALEGLITDSTRAIVLVTPSNPTGAIFPEEELRSVGRIAAAHDLVIVLDDPYRHFTYENQERYFNLASVAGLRDRTAYLFTFSKSYAMTGWRLGYMVVPGALKRQLLKVHDATIICAPRVSQVAALAALAEEPAHLAEFHEALAHRRSLICERLDRLPHVFRYVRPEGAYYVFPEIVAEHENALEFSTRLLEEAGVAVTPGGAFGPTGEHHVRMAYCVSEETIETAFDRLERYFGR